MGHGVLSWGAWAGACLAIALVAGCEKREEIDLDALVGGIITSPESMAIHRQKLLDMEQDGSAAGIFLAALREHDPGRYETVADAAAERMVMQSEEPAEAVRMLPAAYSPELSERLPKLSNEDAAEFIAIRIALDQPLVDSNPQLCMARKSPDFTGDDQAPAEIKDRMMRLAARAIRMAGDYPVAEELELGRWAVEVLQPAYDAHLAELERKPLPDPEAQAARIACDRAMFQWAKMAELPLAERGAIFRATQQPQ